LKLSFVNADIYTHTYTHAHATHTQIHTHTHIHRLGNIFACGDNTKGAAETAQGVEGEEGTSTSLPS